MADSRHQLAFLDGLRGYASLWVLVGHAMFMTGYKIEILAQPDMAVELFIIISGFLMAYHYQARNSGRAGSTPPRSCPAVSKSRPVMPAAILISR
jgi:peptidoglycan/LPS O-acetylase OafA/YrhL